MVVTVLTYDRPHLLTKLHGELLAAVPALVPAPGEPARLLIWGDGTTLTLTVPDDADEQAIAAVVAAHDPTPPPPPVVYTGQQTIERRETTTGTTPAELVRLTLAPLTAYRAAVDLFAVDAGNGNVRYLHATLVAKRLNNGAILVPNAGGQMATVMCDHRDGAAGSWAITPSVSGTDFVVTVAGASGRTVSWFVRFVVDSFSPGGV